MRCRGGADSGLSSRPAPYPHGDTYPDAYQHADQYAYGYAAPNVDRHVYPDVDAYVDASAYGHKVERWLRAQAYKAAPEAAPALARALIDAWR